MTPHAHKFSTLVFMNLWLHIQPLHVYVCHPSSTTLLNNDTAETLQPNEFLCQGLVNIAQRALIFTSQHNTIFPGHTIIGPTPPNNSSSCVQHHAITHHFKSFRRLMGLGMGWDWCGWKSQHWLLTNKRVEKHWTSKPISFQVYRARHTQWIYFKGLLWFKSPLNEECMWHVNPKPKIPVSSKWCFP